MTKTKKWFTPERMMASKKNIKKATTAWDEMHYSLAEGNIPQTLMVGGRSYRLTSVSTDKKLAEKTVKLQRKFNIRARLKPITIGGTSLKGKHIRKRDIYAVYTGGKK